VAVARSGSSCTAEGMELTCGAHVLATRGRERQRSGRKGATQKSRRKPENTSLARGLARPAREATTCGGKAG
jgi:hypothetical protein